MESLILHSIVAYIVTYIVIYIFIYICIDIFIDIALACYSYESTRSPWNNSRILVDWQG